MEDQNKPTPKSDKVFSFLSKDEVEKLRQEEEKKMATLTRNKQQHSEESEEDVFNEDEASEYDNDMNKNTQHSIPKTSTSKIPIRTVNAEKRAIRQQQLPPEYDETKLSPSEIRTLRAQKRAAWRQARLKSLEKDAIQAQIMIQTMNAATVNEDHIKDTFDDSGNEVETCREKIISLELEDPTNQNTKDDIDNGNMEPIQEDSFLENVQTIVEVVNPVLAGDGTINDIVVGCSNDYNNPSYPTSLENTANDQYYEYEEVDYESINSKMKNVLKELKQNEKVKLSLSRSLNEQDEDAGEEGEYEGPDEYEEKTGTNGTLFIVRERLINDFYSHQHETMHEDTIDDCEIIKNPIAEDFMEENLKRRGDNGESLLNVESKDIEMVDEFEEDSELQTSNLPSSTTGSKRKKRKSKKKKF